MITYLGDFTTSETVRIPFNTFTSDDPSASCTITNLAAGDVEIHKDGSTTQRASDNGVTVSIDFDGVTGNHVVSIDLSDNSDAGYYAVGSRYMVRIEGATVDGGTINAWIGYFSIGLLLRASTASATLGTTAIASDLVVNLSDVKVLQSDLKLLNTSGIAGVASDLVVVMSDVKVVISDLALVDTSGIAGVASDLIVTQSDVKVVISDLAVADTAIDALESTGDGSVVVSDTYGGGDYTVKTEAGVGIDNVVIRAYLTTDYDAGNLGSNYVKGSTITTTTGEWASTLSLDLGTYTLLFTKQGYYQDQTQSLVVAEP